MSSPSIKRSVEQMRVAADSELPTKCDVVQSIDCDSDILFCYIYVYADCTCSIALLQIPVIFLKCN